MSYKHPWASTGYRDYEGKYQIDQLSVDEALAQAAEMTAEQPDRLPQVMKDLETYYGQRLRLGLPSPVFEQLQQRAKAYKAQAEADRRRAEEQRYAELDRANRAAAAAKEKAQAELEYAKYGPLVYSGLVSGASAWPRDAAWVKSLTDEQVARLRTGSDRVKPAMMDQWVRDVICQLDDGSQSRNWRPDIVSRTAEQIGSDKLIDALLAVLPPPKAKKNSAKGKLAVKMAAKASGRAVPGVGQVAMVLDGAPVAAGELSDFSSQVSGSFKRQKARMKKGSYREAVMSAPGEALRAQWTLTKGVGRTALAAIVAKEAAEMTKSNPNRRSFSDVYAQLLRSTGTGRLMARVQDSLAPHIWLVKQAMGGHEAWVYYDREERQGNPLASHNLMIRLYPNVEDAPNYVVDAYTNAVWPWVQELTTAEREALGDAANDAVVALAEGWSTDPAASMIFVEALLADLSDHAELMVMTPVAEANPRRRVRRARMNSTKGAYPFAYKQEQYSRYTSDQLRWALRDALKARDAMAHHDVAAENWYADDVHTILAELKRRGEA